MVAVLTDHINSMRIHSHKASYLAVMKFTLFTSMIFLACSFSGERKAEVSPVLQNAPKDAIDTCIDFNSFYEKVRDNKLTKEKAIREILPMLDSLKRYYFRKVDTSVKQTWVFPLQGYDHTSIGGTNGSGYISAGYDFFDGNKHKAHPAHDIFIQDRNMDCLDDGTKKPVNVLSVSAGIVIALEKSWDTSSEQRGGKYVWIYEPKTQSFFYYAHNESVLVELCDIVKPGDLIATVGRTGLNAHKKRSPTHLHIMQLQLDKANYPRPVNLYPYLKSARVVR